MHAPQCQYADVTTPPKAITVECPHCGTRYDDWYRPSLNFDIEEFDADYVRESTTATCPTCGTIVGLETLIVQGGVWTVGDSSSKRTPRSV